MCVLVAPRSEQNGLDPPHVEVSLSVEDGSDVQMDGLERTCDGKYKCSYCSYANKGMARLIEHIRIHTGQCLLLHSFTKATPCLKYAILICDGPMLFVLLQVQ